MAYHDAVRVRLLVLGELLAGTKTRRTNIDTIPWLAYWVRTFHAYRVGELAIAAVALYLQAWLVHGCVIVFT